MAVASFVVLVGATLPTPLYQVYREAFHFSNFTLTLIFGVYALGVIPALFVFGPVGDALCRRRVLMASLLMRSQSAFRLQVFGLGGGIVGLGLFPAVRIFSVIVAVLSLAEMIWLIFRQR